MAKFVSKFLDMDALEVRTMYSSVKFRGKEGRHLIDNGVLEVDRYLDMLVDVNEFLDGYVEQDYIPKSIQALIGLDVKFKNLAVRMSRYNLTAREGLSYYFNFIHKFEIQEDVSNRELDFIKWIGDNSKIVNKRLGIELGNEYKIKIILKE